MNNEQITSYILDDLLYSDIFKEYNGFRPRGVIVDGLVNEVIALQTESGDSFPQCAEALVQTKIARMEESYHQNHLDGYGDQDEPVQPRAWKNFVEVLPDNWK